MVPRVHRMHAAADDTEDWSGCRHVFAARSYKNRITKILCAWRWMGWIQDGKSASGGRGGMTEKVGEGGSGAGR